MLADGQVKVAYGRIAAVPVQPWRPLIPGHGQGRLSHVRALKAATTVAAELLGREDLGVLAPSKLADIVPMPGDPIADISATARDDGWRRLPRSNLHLSDFGRGAATD